MSIELPCVLPRWLVKLCDMKCFFIILSGLEAGAFIFKGILEDTLLLGVFFLLSG